MSPETQTVLIALIAATPPTVAAVTAMLVAMAHARRARQDARDALKATEVVQKAVNGTATAQAEEIAVLRAALLALTPLPRPATPE